MAIVESDEVAKPPAAQPKLVSVLAEFAGPRELMHAAEKIRDSGFTKWDCFTPFPVHGIDDAMGTKRTKLPFIVLCAAICGGTTAIAMQWFCNAYDYPFMISGKPFFSLPSSMPVVFELSVLFSAFATLFGMLGLNGLPQLYNALFKVDNFRRVTDDKFFLGIETTDPKFNVDQTKTLLNSLHPVLIEECWDSGETRAIPSIFFKTLAMLGLLAIVPVVMVAQLRALPSNLPRLHGQWDMDHQPKLKTQKHSELFVDGRGMRLPIANTVAFGELKTDRSFYNGLQGGAASAEITDAMLLRGAVAANGEPVNNGSFPWVTEFPLEVDEQLMARGRERYGIYCAPCHGYEGDGNGLITQRAMELTGNGRGAWVKPVSYHSDPIRMQPVGKLFNTVTNGQGRMPGYASQIPEKDRWAIVLYLKALMKSRDASPDDVPADVKERLSQGP